jgi:ribose/xylose/arabinose/galactoside ABC-type transport system permease subunit
MAQLDSITIFARRRSRTIDLRNTLTDYGALFLLVGFFVFLSIDQTSAFLTGSNLQNIVEQQAEITLLALAETLVMITAGIDLSVGAVVALTGLVAAHFALQPHGGALVPLLVAPALGAGIGLVQALIIVYAGIQPFLVTLAGLSIVSAGALIYTNGGPIGGLNPTFDALGQGSVFGVPCPILVIVVVGAVIHYILRHTATGRHIYAIGGGEETALKLGVNIARTKLALYTASGLLAGLGGAVLTARVDGADPLAGSTDELTAIAAAVIGGTSLFGGVGNVPGTFIGVLLLGVLNNGLAIINISAYYQEVAIGLVLLVAVILRRWHRT